MSEAPPEVIHYRGAVLVPYAHGSMVHAISFPGTPLDRMATNDTNARKLIDWWLDGDRNKPPAPYKSIGMPAAKPAAAAPAPVLPPARPAPAKRPAPKRQAGRLVF